MSFENVLFIKRLNDEVHLVAKRWVAKSDYRACSSLDRVGAMALIQELRRAIACLSVDVECRFIIVLHAVGQIGFRSFGKIGIFCRIGEAPPKVGLMQPAVLPDGIDDTCAVGLHNNLLICTCCCQSSEKSEARE